MLWTKSPLLKNLSSSKLIFLLFVVSHCTISTCAHILGISKQPYSQYSQSRNRLQGKLQVFNCPKQGINVVEEQPIGTEVYTIEAGYQNETNHYVGRALSTNWPYPAPFLINGLTGLMTTTRKFDRDFPIGEKEFNAIVELQNPYNSRQITMCAFKVTITDINDNPPTFYKATYSKSLPKNSTVGTEVIRIFADDFDEDINSLIKYTLLTINPDSQYFGIDADTGFVYLKKDIDKNPGEKFELIIKAIDRGTPPLYSTVPLTINIVESDQKHPSFDRDLPKEIKIPENVDIVNELLKFRVSSNVDNDPTCYVKVYSGQPEEKFRVEQEGNEVSILLASPLDYETKTSYQLDIVIKNSQSLTTQKSIIVKVEDVNDCKPYFLQMIGDSIYENVKAGAEVGYIRAFDNDGTSPNNKVSYKLLNYHDEFELDPTTGTIKSLVAFDREIEETYIMLVEASDNAPSSLRNDSTPNSTKMYVYINILDRNDCPPTFESSMFTTSIVEGSHSHNRRLYQVEANDEDLNSKLNYKIIDGNINDTFRIEEATGWIKVNKNLDYETIPEYNLTIEVFDGIYRATTQLKISVENANDNPPKFDKESYEATIYEEDVPTKCIVNVTAHDADQKGQNETITYYIFDLEMQKFIEVDQSGCIRVKKPFDRDPPNGSQSWRIVVGAKDEDPGHSGTTVLTIDLLDINDNVPFLNMTNPVVWNENQPANLNHPQKIIDLKAADNDTPENGPPFTFEIDESAGLSQIFKIDNNALYALKQFDREERKSYNIPIVITDSGTPKQTGTSTLTVIIGDENDNIMNEGFSSITVYKYKDYSPGINIGRVYVNDPDDWDLPDKHFTLLTPQAYFDVEHNGTIIMKPNAINGTYELKFNVTDRLPHYHFVNAYVNITIKPIPEEAIVKSGSIRFDAMSAEEFIESPDYSPNRREKLQQVLAKLLKIPTDNVDVFTVIHPRHDLNFLDVRFSAHGSPYYAPEKLNTIASTSIQQIETEVDASVLLISINECLFENVHCNGSCHNTLQMKPEPYAIYTNMSSFVGVEALAVADCNCDFKRTDYCLHGGTLIGDICECPPGYDGSRCQSSAIGFHGDGWAVMPPIDLTCENSYLKVEVSPQNDSGLILYQGPMIYNSKLNVRDFIALEVKDGYSLLHMNYGNHTVALTQNVIKLTDGKSHIITVNWTESTISMEVDGCKSYYCNAVTSPGDIRRKTHKYINVNYPIQIGGTVSNITELGSKFQWNRVPTNQGFSGWIKNLEINGKIFNLGEPSYSHSMSEDNMKMD